VGFFCVVCGVIEKRKAGAFLTPAFEE